MTINFSGTRPVSGSSYDFESLFEYLEAALGPINGPPSIEQFNGGQSNPTFKINLGPRSFVLRCRPMGEEGAKSAHAVGREFRVLSALRDSNVPVPEPRLQCEDASVFGSEFYLMDYVDGRIFWDPTLPSVEAHERGRYYEEISRVIAELHQIDYQSIGLSDFGKPQGFLERQLRRWAERYRACESEPNPDMERLLEWLPANIPKEQSTCLTHGDYKLDNLIFHPTEPRIIAVLDWELSTLGDPLVDLAYACLGWHIDHTERRGLRGLDLTALGIPLEPVFVSKYLALTGRPRITDWTFYLAFNMFRFACILEGIRARAMRGTAVNKHAIDVAARSRKISKAGWNIVENGPVANDQGPDDRGANGRGANDQAAV